MAPKNKGDSLLLDESANHLSFIDGRILATPEPGEEVCITGLSGAYPNSRNVKEFRDNLINKIDMIDGDFRRWRSEHPEIPQRTGKIYDADKFDAGFFGIHHRQAHIMEPILRILLEKTTEAIFDAGLHPSELENSNTGVFAGIITPESETYWFHCNPDSTSITGCMQNNVPHRLSYYFKLKGPSTTVDTACSSSLFAFEHAYRAMRMGECDTAIVVGGSLCLQPITSLHFARLGVLSEDGSCKSFDANGNGYARSEAISVVLLQKAKISRRVYFTIVHAKTNCDGYKQQGITYPSGESQKELLVDFYKECNVDPRSLSFIEAHGTGTKVGDPEECNAIDDALCNGREEPLLIGSVKSNIGHSEPASGLCSITKVIIAVEEGYIPPNINFSKPREELKGLIEGRMKVVTERMPFQDDRGLIAMNSFGFGGANCHVLLKWNTKSKVNDGEPKDDLPRLVCVSGRTPESITVMTDDVNSRKLDAEHIQLLHEIFKKDIHPHPYRGYTIVSKKGEIKSSMRNFDGIRPNLVLAFGSFEDSWQFMIKSLLAFPVFSATIHKIRLVLTGANSHIDLMEIIDNRATNVHPVVKNILGNVTLHIGIVEILKSLKLNPDFIVGYALGELSCGYFDGSLSLDQTVLLALQIADHIKMLSGPSSSFIVRVPEAQIRKLIPTSIDIIWKNNEDSVIISGHPNITQKFAESLQDIGVVVEHISSSSVTWISGKFSKNESVLTNMKKILPNPRKRGDKWISGSTEELASAEYFIDAVSSGINLPAWSSQFEKDPVIFELGLGGFSKLLKNTTQEHIEVVKFEVDSNRDGVIIFSDVLGCLYENGYNPQIQNLYPRIQYPVSRGTPMISPIIRWNHHQKFYVLDHRDQYKAGQENWFRISLKNLEEQYLTGHMIDGRNLFPATGYLNAAWEAYARSVNIHKSALTIVFEDSRFIRATTISKEVTELMITIQRSHGNFEIVEDNTAVMIGRVYALSDDELVEDDLSIPSQDSRNDTIPLRNKDIYKEFNLRGYNYQDVFKGIEECNQEATVAWVRWNNNWVSFMDNMLQVKLLQMDTRNLYVPTGLKKVTINAKQHVRYAKSFGENPLLPVYINHSAGVIRCGGIEIKGLMANSIPRRKQLGQPVLEKYEFVPNDFDVSSLEESVRINTQIGLENNYAMKIKIVEFLDETTKKDSETLAPLVHKALSDQPLVQTDITLLTTKKLELENVKVENKKLESETDCNLIIGTNILRRSGVLHQVYRSLKDKGFILSREDPDFDVSSFTNRDQSDVDIMTVHHLESEKLVYFRRRVNTKEYEIINVSQKDGEFGWLPSLQAALKNDSHVLIYSQGEDISGVLGLFNCVSKESGGMNVRCFIVFDKNAPPFDEKHPFYAAQIEKNMCVNIYKNGHWGTYRHLLMDQMVEVETEHCYVNTITRGDLSSLRWIEGNLNSKTVLPPEKTLVQIYFASLNFRDVMTASAKISADVITMNRAEQECVQGCEFSGKTLSGRRVMGLLACGALSTQIAADNYLLWNVPEHWTLEEAATVPVVYGTVLYALVIRGKIRRGQSILIHSGTGGVGQSAINIALSYGCTVYTTVGTKEKRETIKKLFPHLTDRHIGSSRDTSFEQLVMEGTGGRGVDMVLNSLAEEKLIASVRCLAKGGKFLEIGKFDLANNNSLALLLLSKDCSFHGIMLDKMFNAEPPVKKILHDLIVESMKTGAIKPLTTNVFKGNDVEQAFRFMASGKHMGKVLIEVRKEEPSLKAIPPVMTFKAHPRFHCNQEKSYVIIGGLGGFGLELADWLVLRGATKLVLTSRNGIKTGYQYSRVNMWKSYGVDVKISTADITTREGCDQLISEAQDLGPVDHIFNLAVVLKDSLLENQSPESFSISFGPKATATRYLDEITRIRCPNLSNFVVFSSVSCGRGNAGQTNYGMANSIMERICEKRRNDGFPALAIEWGAIGDVGLVADMMENHIELEIGGTLQQKISSCLEVMDVFLRQTQAAVVSSMVVATKKSSGGGADNILDAVSYILGVKKESVSPQTTLAELGMDSMSAVEVKQTLERDFEVFLTAQEIRTMTFAKLQEIQQATLVELAVGTEEEGLPTGIELIMGHLGDESESMEPVLNLPSLCEGDPKAPYVFCFPGIEGFATTLKSLSVKLQANVIGVQFPFKNPKNSYLDLAKEAVKQIEKLHKPNAILNIVAYSWGSIIALETLALLEKKGVTGNLVCLDGAPCMAQEICRNEFNAASDAEVETLLICHLLGFYNSQGEIRQNKERIYNCNNYEERIKVFQEISKDLIHSPKYLRDIAIAYLTRLTELKFYSPKYPKIKSPVRLFKPTNLSVQNIEEDYGLSQICTDLREVKIFEGNHVTIVGNAEVAEAINGVFALKPPSLPAKIQNVEPIKATNGIVANGN